MNQMNHPSDDDLLALLLADEAGSEHVIKAGCAPSHGALSFAQQRLWFLQQFDPQSCAYNLPRALRLNGPLNADALEQALNAVIDKHDILRTRFVEIDNLAQQQVDRQARLILARHNLGELPATERDAAIRRHHDADLAQPFDLSQAPLIRGTLLRTGASEHVLLLNMHHIVSDAWSNAILLQDLAQAFAQAQAGLPGGLQRPSIQYADYAHWQRHQYPLSAAHERATAHWKQLLDGELPSLDLPFDRPHAPDQLHLVGNHCLTLPASLGSALQRFCQQQGLTPFIVLLGAWQLLLGRYTGQHDFTVGVPNATRSQGQTQALVGFFVSSQVYRARLDGAQPVAEFLQRLREQSLAALEHADYPIELILEDLQLQRSTQANPLFQTLFNWRVANQDAAQLRLDGLEVEFLGVEQQQAKFDLSLEIDYSQQQIDATFSYSTALFLPQTIKRLAGHWQHLLQGLVETPQLRLGELPMLERAEQQMALHTWNATATDFGAHANLQTLFERQAHATPDAVAVRLGSAALTYRQLNQRANRLAHKLLELGVGAEVGVGIACERSLEMVIGLLGVLKAGGAYVPLDTGYPQDRLAYMIEHSDIALLLTQASVHPGLLLPEALPVMLLEQADNELQGYADSNPTPVVDADNLAYIIYTSGSTGRPKGVQVRHGALTNHMLWMQQTLQLQAQDRVLQKTAFSFDASVWEFWLPLLNGAQLVLAGPELNDDMSLLWPEVQAQRITVLQAAPSLLQALMGQAERTSLASLRAILLGGEALSPALVQQLRSVSDARIYNLYGPSEATIDTCCYSVPATPDGAIVPIGQPISNLRTHVLDHELNPCAIGVSGELLIGGVALARGYHARPGLTAERFVPDPFAGHGERLYRSGDLTRYRDDGVIDYVGRIDHQIKLHGLRIELGEIEARLLRQPQVAEAVVLAPDYLGNQRLVAYVVATRPLPDAQAQDQLRQALIAGLKQQLPAYMVPAHLLLLDGLPLTRNGKLDRKALPMPDTAPTGYRYAAPQSAMERQIAMLWQEVLKQPNIGLNDNFFELGGDSIVSIQVVSRARQAGIRFTPKQLFQHQTVQGLAQVAQFDDPVAHIDQGPASGTVALLPIQQAFFDTPVPSRHHWNQSVLLKPAGQPLDAAVLEQAVNTLINHHDALRLSFTQQAQGWNSVYRAPADAHNALLQAVACDDRELEQLCERAQRSLDLEHGPLLRALLVSLADGRQRLLLVAHHLVIDGVSWRILFDDLQSAYQQCLAGQPPQLPARTSSLQAFAQALREHARGQAIGELDYWLDQHQAIAADLPDARSAMGAPAQVALLDSHLDSERTRRLLQQAPAAYRTQVNDLLLSALARVLARWTGQADNLIQLEGHGREELSEGLDLTRTVGWFTSAFPLRLSAGHDLQATIKQVKEQLRGIPDKGIGFGALRYLGEQAVRDVLQALPDARITFNYLGQFDTSFDDTQQPLLIPASEAAGAEKHADAPLSNWLSINGQVYAGELSLSWTYDQNRFAPQVIERLAEDYVAELGALIDHCCDRLNQGATPSDFPLAGLDQAQLDALPIDLALIDDLYPLSPLQQGMLFHTLYEQEAHDLDGRSYINQMRLDISGLDPQAFAEAWQAAVDRHDSLRTVFLWQGEMAQPLQAVYRQMRVPFSLLDWQQRADLPGALDALAAEQLQQDLALDKAALFRLVLVCTAPGHYHLIHTSHHILMDGWSTSQLLGEVLQRYSGQALATPPGRYRDYIDWLGRQDAVLDQAYWHTQLADLEEPTRLAHSVVNSTPAQGHGACYLNLDAPRTQRLNDFARQQKVTLNTLVQAAWLVVLQQYSGQRCVCFGATVAGRPADIAGVEQQIGLFINTLPVIASPRPDVSVASWLQQVQEINLGLREHEHTALSDIQRWSGQQGEALFDNILVFENYPVAEALEQEAPAGLTFGAVDYHEQTNYPLTLAISAGDSLLLHASYSRQHFSGAGVQAIGEHLLNLLERMRDNPRQHLGELEMLAPTERQQVVQAWNATSTEYPLERCVHQLIEDQVERTPGSPALVFGGQHLSYAELNSRANQLAHALIARGIGPDVLVGIAMERSIEMVVALLATLKAGGAYVPLDPEYPRERLGYLFDDSGIALLLTQQPLLAQLPVPEGLPLLALDTLDLSEHAQSNPDIALHPENLAYVIYTSGSTGNPKGAGNRHSALTNRLCWMQQAYALDASDTVLQKTPFSFDVSVWEFFWPLMTGARLVVAAPGDHRDPARLVALINQHQVSTLHFVPSMLQAFLLDAGVPRCTSLTRIVCSGEALPVDAQQQVFAKLPNAGLYNLYGPTEAAIDVTHWTCRDEGRNSVPIGQPIANLGAYVLSADLLPLPAGATGELYLTGAGLARGYHRRAALTAERFVASPFGAGQRLYRTGDLARQRADGVIDYMGRVDHQVKIRGLRIELGEIEAHLLELNCVREASVLAVEAGSGLQLAAYLVASDATLASASSAQQAHWRDAVRQQLLTGLPDYMVPTHLILLEQLPLSPNGKLDRKALPGIGDAATRSEHVAASNPLEQQLAAIWQAVLKLDRVGVTDNFFELGGDSIISIQVVSRARQAGIRFTPKALFEHQTIQRLATVAQTSDARSVVDQSPLQGETALLPIQQMFFELPMPERHHWNQAVLLKANARLDAAALHQALQSLVLHHDALRLQFTETARGWTGEYRSQAAQREAWAHTPLLWQHTVSDAHALQALAESAQRSLDLEGGLVRALLAELADGSQRLLLVIHHLAVDGVSWRILFEDLQAAYRRAVAGHAVELPARTRSLRAWAEQLQAFARHTGQNQELAYWQQLHGASNDLPCDRAADRLINRNSNSVQVVLDKQRTRQLLQQAPAAYRTQVNDLLLSALAQVITRWSGHDDLLLQLEGHGREELFEDMDLTRTVGWFTSLFPVRLTPASTLGGTIKQIKEQLRAIPNKGIGFGALRYLGDAQTQQTMQQLPVPRLTFNYLGQLDGTFDSDEGALFAPAAESAGIGQSLDAPQSNWLTLNCQVFAGELSLTWGYNSAMYDASTIEGLAEDYLHSLSRLIEHCLQADNHGLTPSDVPLARMSQAQLDALPLSAQQVETLYPLAPMQQGMLFHTLYQQQAGDYINQMRLDVRGLDAERFRAAWQATVDAHDILRSGFLWQGQLDEPLQVVHKRVELPFSVLDWRERQGCSAALDTLAGEELMQPFDLQQPPLLRLFMVRTGEDSHHLIYTHHHILMDGWSNSQMMGEVMQRYHGQRVPQSSGRYSDYIAWLQQQDPTLSETFWKAQVQTLDAPTRLAAAITAQRSPGSGHAHLEAALEQADTARLETFARQQKVTPNTLVQAAWLIVLQRYCAQATVCFGATVSGRPAELSGVEQQLGLFINTLPVVATPLPELSVGQWLQQVQAQNLSLREHEHTPLFEIQRLAGKNAESLFDTLLVFENYPISQALEQTPSTTLHFGSIRTHEQTNYPLTLMVGFGAMLTLQASYDQAHFDTATVEKLAHSLLRLLRAMLDSPDQAIGDLVMLAPQEQHTVLLDWNLTSTHYPLEQPVHQLIEAQVQQTPNAPALVFGGQHLSYAELNSRANQLAHALIARGIGPDVLVGIAMERSIEMVVALLATLKAGGAYVPLDPEYPRERLGYLFDDSGIALLLTQQPLLAQLPVPEGLPLLALDTLDLSEHAQSNPDIALHPENLAYVIYTSGSTGNPKGAGNRHSALTNRLCWMQQAYALDASDTVLQKTPFSFDVSVWEFFWPLMTGARLVVAAPGDHRDPARLVALINQHQVSTLHFVPSMLQAFLLDAGVPRCTSLTRIVCSGEALPVDAQQQVFAKLPNAGLYNLYGPTEAAIDVTHWTCREEGKDGVPIGQPIANLQTYILGDDLGLLPAGVTGELYLAGEGLARGYHRRAALTAERFVTSPFGEGKRLYRTGDLACYRTDGVIEYRGRIDHQVKIRGLRIELGEIEARLMALDAVREAVVLAIEGATGQQLVGYVVPSAGTGQDDLREHLRHALNAHLPDYMIPAQWVWLKQMPLSPNGKLERKALPKPDASQLQREYVAPQSELEQRIAAIWQHVLGCERIGLHDNFFELGGHSLMVIRVMSRMQLDVGIQVSPHELFQFPVLGDFTAQVAQLGAQVDTTKLSKLEALFDELEEV